MKLPHHWQTLRVRDLGRVVTGRTPPSDIAHCFGGEVPFITPGDLGRGKIVRSTERTLTENGVSKVNVVRRGSVFFTCIGLIGKTGQALSRSAFNQQINAIEPSEDFDDSFVFYLITKLGPYIARLAGAVTLPIVNKSEFCDFPISVPPLPEQRKIAAILSTWDEALEKLNALIAAKERRKKALIQQLLTGQKRVKGFDRSDCHTKSDHFGKYPADWKWVALGNITREVSRRNPSSEHLPVLSCTKHRGLVLSEEYFGKRVYADDTSNYRMVARGEFAYATNHIEEGSIGYQNLCFAGLVSPIYTVFRTTEKVDDAYLFRVLKSPLLIHLYRVNTSFSVDRRGSLRYDEFAAIHIWLPSKREQVAIANILDTCDEEINILRSQRAVLNQQKRGLMQRLLTGAIRVRLEK